MTRSIAACILVASLSILGNAQNPREFAQSQSLLTSSAADGPNNLHWIGTWGAAPQPFLPGRLETFRNQTLRLIVHVSTGGAKVRVGISNLYGDHPLVIGAAHIAIRTSAANIDPASDRALSFHNQPSATVPPKSAVTSDPVDLKLPALSDVAISLFFPESAEATTTHVLAQQTNYISETGNSTAAAKFPVAKTTHSWPFLIGIDVAASSGGTAIVAFGSSLTDGDGSTRDANRRWPDVLAERLQKRASARAEVGVVNEGIIGNRLLRDSPQQSAPRFGAALGESGIQRFERDVLNQAGARFVIIGLGINDIAFPGSLTSPSEPLTAEMIISAYRQLIARAHDKGIRVIGTTNPPFENSFLELDDPAHPLTFFTAEKEMVRQKVNDWIRNSGEFDAAIDFDQVVRDPAHPTRINPAYDSGDHLHPNDAGCTAEGDAVPLSLFEAR